MTEQKFATLCPPLPVTDLPVITVAAAADTNYCPHMAALIASVFFHADKEKFTDFIVLDGGLSTEEKEKLTSLEALHPHARISFINMSRQFSGVKIYGHLSSAAFYRLNLPDILVNRQRCLYLDSDIITLSDVSKIFATDLEGKAIAAVRDSGVYTGSFGTEKSKCYRRGKRLLFKEFMEQSMKMDSWESYFNSGVILFDLDKVRALNLTEAMAEDLRTHNYIFMDQDVLNKFFCRRVKYLPVSQNFFGFSQDNGAIKKFGKYFQEYDEARQNPQIIHYYGGEKPWKKPEEPQAEYYWQYLKMTPFYQQVSEATVSLQKEKKSGLSLFLFRRRKEYEKFSRWGKSFLYK